MKVWDILKGVFVLIGIVALCVIVYLVAPVIDRTILINYEQKDNYSKEQFYVEFLEAIWGQSDKEISGELVHNTSVAESLALAAEYEYELFTSKGLKGGYRYWYWWDNLTKYIEAGDIDSDLAGRDVMKLNDYIPGGVYQKAALEKNKNYWNWCNCFVSCCAQRANISTGNIDARYSKGYVNMGLSVKRTYQFFTEQNYVECIYFADANAPIQIGGTEYTRDEYTPKRGDLVLFAWEESADRDGLDHIGIVVGYDEASGVVTTIEGNTTTSPADVSLVDKKQRNYKKSKYISGFISFVTEKSDVSYDSGKGNMSGLLTDDSGMKYYIYSDGETKDEPILFVFHGTGTSVAELDGGQLAVYELVRNGTVNPGMTVVYAYKDWTQSWVGSTDKTNKVSNFINNISTKYRVDKDEMYFYGFSYGAYDGPEIIKASGYVFKSAVFNDGNVFSGNVNIASDNYLSLDNIFILEAAENQVINGKNNVLTGYKGNLQVADFSGQASHSWINGYAAAQRPGDAVRWGCNEVGNIFSWLLNQ